MRLNSSMDDRSSIVSDGRDHNYVNLNQTYSGQRKPSQMSNQLSNNNRSYGANITPMSIPYKDVYEKQNHFTPASSIVSNSPPPSLADPKSYIASKYSTQRLQSIASTNTVVSNRNNPLNAIDEDRVSNRIDLATNDLLNLCLYDDPDVQANALAYLQHCTFKNREMKLDIVNSNGLMTIIELTVHPDLNVSIGALGVLKNISYVEDDMIANHIQRLGGLQKMMDVIESNTNIEDDNLEYQQELAIDVVWNLSTKQDLKIYIVRDVVSVLLRCILIPCCCLEKQPSGNFVRQVPLDNFSGWSPSLRNALGILRNISYNDIQVRMKLRNEDGLIDCLINILRQIVPNKEVQMELLDSKIVENATCILRNLTFALQEIIDKDYHSKKLNSLSTPTDSSSASPKKHRLLVSSKSNSNNSTTNKLRTPNNTGEEAKGMELLWNAQLVVSCLAPILYQASSAVTLEAATGIIQNLTAGDWQPSEDVRVQVRLHQIHGTLVELINIGTDEVIRSAATALRNVTQEVNCRQLVGSSHLDILTNRIPLDRRQLDNDKSIGACALGALLTVIYVVIKQNVDFMKIFVENKGIPRCEFVRDCKNFIVNDDEYPTKVRYFSECILKLLSRYQLLSKSSKMNNKNYRDQPDSISMDPMSTPHMIRMHNSLDAPSHTNPRYSMDQGGSEIVSNAKLQQRNSAAYTTNAIPGYGDVKIPANQKNTRPYHSNNRYSNVESVSESINAKNAVNYRSTPISSDRCEYPEENDEVPHISMRHNNHRDNPRSPLSTNRRQSNQSGMSDSLNYPSANVHVSPKVRSPVNSYQQKSRNSNYQYGSPSITSIDNQYRSPSNPGNTHQYRPPSSNNTNNQYRPPSSDHINNKYNSPSNTGSNHQFRPPSSNKQYNSPSNTGPKHQFRPPSSNNTSNQYRLSSNNEPPMPLRVGPPQLISSSQRNSTSTVNSVMNHEYARPVKLAPPRLIHNSNINDTNSDVADKDGFY